MIREAVVDDAHQIATVQILAWQYVYAGIVNESFLQGMSIEDRTSRWQQILTQNIEDNYVAEDNGKIVGWISFGRSRDENATDAGEIYGIYILPDCWMRGFGRELMEFAESNLWQQGFSIITLWVLELNDKSRNFYSKVGYSFDGTKKSHFIGEQELQIVRYTKKKV